MTKKVCSALALLNLALAAWVITTLPEVVPVHFNLWGQPDRFGTRWWYLLTGALPVIAMAIYLIYERATKDNERVKKNRAIEEKVIPIISLVFALVGWLLLIVAKRGGTFSADWFGMIYVLMGLLMVFINNFMGKISQNRNFGIKLPWTFKDEVVWNKTNRLGGYVGVVIGIAMIIGGVIGVAGHPGWASGVFFAALLLYLIIPTVYAYRLYKSRHPAQ